MPEFLASAFGPTVLDGVGTNMAALDPSGQILWANAAWYRFARDNGGDFVPARYPSYFDGISGPLRASYERVFADIIASGDVFEQNYECSSPDTIRHYRMRVLPFLPGGLLVEHTEIATHPAPAGEPPDEALYLDDNQLIIQCSNCRRVRRPMKAEERWVWIPQWVTHSHPQTSHGLCTPCFGYYWRRTRRSRR